MSVSDLFSDAGSSASEASGGDSESSLGSSSSTVTDDAADWPARIKAARLEKRMTRNALDTAADLGAGVTKRIEEGERVPGSIVLRRIANVLDMPGLEGEPEIVSQTPRGTSDQGERRPSSDGKPKRRGLLNRKPRRERTGASTTQSRPYAKRVSTSPFFSAILTFTTGGIAKMGQAPLASVMSFTAPVAGEIVDDVVAGTLVDKMVQPLVRGSEKYQNMGALLACWASVAWATNVPESEREAFELFRWSMHTLLPLQGKEMVRRAKAEQKMLEAWNEVQPELVAMFGPDPIAGIWQMMYAQPEPQTEKEPAVA